MTSKFQMYRTTVFGRRPPTGAGARPAGNPYVNFADKQLGVVDTAGVPQDLIGVTFFSTLANYNPGNIVNYQGNLYQALTSVTAGAWNSSQWTSIATQQWVNSLGQAGGFLNIIRNGNFVVAQRGTSIYVPANSGAWVADGWNLVSGANLSVGINTSGVGVWGGYLAIYGAAGNANPYIGQRIESNVAAKVSGQVCTFQCYIYNASGTSISPYITVYNPTSPDTWTGTNYIGAFTMQTIPAATGWYRCAVTFQMPSSAANGLMIYLVFNATWQGSGQYVAVSAVDLRATPTAPLGVNSNPPPPELRHVGIEMANCMRYYQFYPQYTWGEASLSASAGWYMSHSLGFPKMRTTPTVTFSNINYSGYAAGIAVMMVTNGAMTPEIYMQAASGGWNVNADVALSAEL